MNDKLQELAKQYDAALQSFLAGKGEEALQRAYEIGRKTIEDGFGCLDLLRIHDEALRNLLGSGVSAGETSRIMKSAIQFFAESLSPYEITHRGFQESIETLRKRAEELAEVNEKLQEEIGDRKQAEKALRESEERYRELVDTARDVIYTLSPDGQITSLNPAFETITGWPNAEWLGKPFPPIVHPDDLALAMKMFEHVMSGESPPVFELRVLSKNGGTLVGEFVTTPQFHERKVVGVLGVARDITARKRAEEKLRENEEMFRLITGNIADLIAIVDTKGRRLYNSPSYSPLLGDPQLLRGTDSFAEIHPDDRERIKGVFKHTIATGVGHREEYKLLTKDGTIRTIESQGNVIRGSDGEIEKVVMVSRDITDRKIADKKLKHSQTQLAAAQQLAHIGSWEWDITENKVGLSDELYRIYGLRPGQFRATYEAFLDRVHPDDREMVKKSLDASYRTVNSFRFEHRIVRTDGTIRTVEDRGEVVTDGKGRPVKITGTSQDITERKEADQALRILTKRVVDAQEEERQRIARELHDDICQRLSAMKLKIETLEEGVENRRSKLFLGLQKARHEIGSMINEVRRISANLRPTTLDDLGLVTALERLCTDFEKSQGLEVRLSANGFSQNGTDGDVEITLYRIAQEALSNVSKHARAKKVNIEISNENGAVRLTIKDDGKGFEIQKSSRRKDLSGFGLINMQERASLVGGTFTIESVPKKGTVVQIEIPFKTRAPYEKN